MEYVLVAHRADLERAHEYVAAGKRLVAGSLHVKRQLDLIDLSAISAEELLSAGDKAEVVTMAGRSVDLISAELERAAVPPELAAIALANAVKALFTFYAVREVEAKLGAPLLRPENGNFVKASLRTAPKLRYARNDIGAHVPARLGRSGYEIDFRSPSGLKIADKGTIPRFHLKLTSNPPWINFIENLVLSARRSKTNTKTVKWGVSRSDAIPILGPLQLAHLNDPEAADIIGRVITDTATGFYDYRAGMRTFLSLSGVPQRAFFNHVAHQGFAGFVAALGDAGVVCEMASHGALVDYGDGPRDISARSLGNAMYNNFPSMAQITPRSPLQARSAKTEQKVAKKVRLVPALRDRCPDAPFKIYYAPNFQPWHECFHGMTVDCFETYSCIDRLVAVVKTLDGFELDLRIKTTVADTARKNTVPHVRGILPDDTAHLIFPSRGVYDASFGSHTEHLSSCDLVVTEGLTAVMFEALEWRKPLLLLNPNGHIFPSLPHLHGSDLLRGAPRSAVYAASKDDDLGEILLAIAKNHIGTPLTRSELKDYIWV